MLSCHLSLQRDERLAQADLLLERLAAMGVEHAVAGGDLNDVPTGKAFRHLAGPLQDCRAVAPWGGELTFPRTNRASASTRSSRPPASRCSAAASRPVLTV